ncbi:MAG: biotin synthase auxiliary protein BsaP [Actinomycetota bacterium]
MTDRFCTACGQPGCPGCSRPLDPPRFCPQCGKRLRVQVTPTEYQARCTRHGRV